MLAEHIDKLRAFVTIAETGKIREAAARLHLTQPSVTRILQTLENSAGVALFHRSRDGVSLTEAGRILHEYALRTLKDLRDVEQQLRYPTKPTTGHVVIGTFESLAEYLWPDFIRHLSEQAPFLKISLRTFSVKSHMQSLIDGQLDISVEAQPQSNERITSWKLYTDKFNFYAATGSPSAFSTKEAGQQRLIFVPAAVAQNNKSILQHLEEQQYFFDNRIELDSFTAVQSFGRKGLGIAVLPERLAQPALAAGELTPVKLDGFSTRGFGQHNICASVPNSKIDDPRIRFVVKALQKWQK